MREKEFQFRRESNFSMSFLTAISIMVLGVENGFKAAESMISANKIYNIEENSREVSSMAEVPFYANLLTLVLERI